MSILDKLNAITEDLDELKTPVFEAEDEKNVEDEKEDTKEYKDDEKVEDDEDDEESVKESELTTSEQLRDLAVASIAEEVSSIKFEVDTSAISGLCESQDFEPEFAKSVVSIFEATINEAVQSQIQDVIESAAQKAVEIAEVFEQKLEEDVDAYLGHVIAEWTEENKVALAHNAKVELTESFLEGLKDLFVEHYIDVPESKQDLYEAAMVAGEQVVAELQEAQEKAELLESEVIALKREIVINTVVEGLSVLKADKVKAIAESIEFDSVESFTNKVKMVAESVSDSKLVKRSSTFAVSEDEGTVIEPLVEDHSQYKDLDVQAALNAISRVMR